MPITATPLAIREVLLIEPEAYRDDRGYLFEAWNEAELSGAIGRTTTFVQDNQSRSREGVLRGLHFQNPEPQGKLVRVVGGRAYTVAVDVRRSSESFGSWVAVELSVDNRRQVWIPPGFAHGSLALCDNTELVYKLTAYHQPGCSRTISWDDPAIGIEWPLVDRDPILSDRDRVAPRLAEVDTYE